MVHAFLICSLASWSQEDAGGDTGGDAAILEP